MAYWLVKSDPDTWHWDQHVEAGVTCWDGVRNHQAHNNMKAMKVGDRVLFYHSGEDRQIVGIVEVARTVYPDPSDKSGRFGMVDLKAVKPLKKPVTLKQIKAEKKLAHLLLVRNSRLSVMPIDAASWKLICKMGDL